MTIKSVIVCDGCKTEFPNVGVGWARLDVSLYNEQTQAWGPAPGTRHLCPVCNTFKEEDSNEA